LTLGRVIIRQRQPDRVDGMQRKARYLIGGARQRYLFRGRFLCKHFSILSLFSLASGLALAGRATGIPSCCAQPSQLRATRLQDRPFHLCVYQPKSERACRACSLCCHPVLYHLRACQHCSPRPLPPINKPTRYHSTTTLHTNIDATPTSPQQSAIPHARL
jgi:hypothetical protein